MAAWSWACLFGILAVALAVLLVNVSSHSRRTTDAIVQEFESLETSNEVELRLLTYHRISNLLGTTSQRTEVASVQAIVQTEIRALLDDAKSLSADRAELAKVNEVSAAVERYLEQRDELESRNVPTVQLVQQVTPSLDKALAEIESLRNLDRSAVRRSHSQVRELDLLSSYTGIAAALLLLVGILTLLLGVSRYVLRPLAGIHESLDRFRAGDLEARAPELGWLETSEIAHALNETTAALGSQRKHQLAFLAGVAHDLRNPLAALKMQVQLLRRQRPPSAEAIGPTLALLDRQLDRLNRMVNDLLDATRIEAGDLQMSPLALDLRKPAHDIVELYSSISPSHQLTLDAPEQPVWVKADPLRIEQVISNLVSNAIKYSPGGGPVRVQVGRAEAEAWLLVQDHGVGIPREETADIFMPFRRRAATRDVAPGAGLGLSVVRRIVTAHGGRIEVESTPGEGSSFRVWLPLEAGQTKATS